MKALMLSIKPKYVVDILNGRKTIEIRKSIPKCDLPIDVYIYCTKDKDYDLFLENGEYQAYFRHHRELHSKRLRQEPLNGKVVARFWCDKVETIKLPYTYFGTNKWVGGEHERTLQTETMDEKDLLKASCISEEENYKYLNFKHSPNCCGYAIHITKLEIFDRPKELNEFWNCTEKKCIYSERHKYMHCRKYLTRAPQSYMFIEVEL